MVKAYLRYEFSASFGLITSSSNPAYDASGKLLFTSSLESISVWNAKQGSLVRQLSPVLASTSSGGGSSGTGSVAEVTVLCCAPSGGSTVAAGYSDGTVRLWDFQTGECTVTFKGHKTGVSCLRYNGSGALLVSGGRDTDVIVWDVAGETGLYRLRGHKDQVTDVAFLSRQSKLASCSKDGLVKIWDLDTQHCCQTVGGHKAEVWSLDINPAGTRLATGATDNEIRVFAVRDPEAEAVAAAADAGPGATATAGAGAGAAAGAAGDGGPARDHRVLEAMGSVRRGAASHERVAMLRFSGDGAWLGVQGAGRGLELFRVRDEEEARRKLKRRKRRRKEKAAKKADRGKGKDKGDSKQPQDDEEEQEGGSEEDGEGLGAAVPEDDDDILKASDELEAVQLVSSKGGKIKSFCFSPPAARLPPDVACRLTLSLSNNTIEIMNISASDPPSYDTVSRVDLGGHRSDVRALALAADDSALLTASSSALKLWNPRTGACLATMDSGYGLSVLFAPGGKFAVLGTKEGSLEVFDLGAATRVHVEERAHGGAVWSLAPLPNKTGFISGAADKAIKIWQWSVVSVAGGPRQLRLSHVRSVSMADDVLAVRTSPDGRLLAAALLDSTVKVYYADSMKFFLSLYGHKLPVLCMDVSSDSTLLLTGSSDKNIKVWGLDFGDCHKSLFAHGDAVMSVAWVPGTHYAFSAGRDRLLKYWDLDRFELLLELPGHHAELWCLAVSQFGDFVVTGSHDRSIRRWERSAEPFFVEEEREKRLESLFEADMELTAAERDAAAAAATDGTPAEGVAAPAGRRTLETVGAADSIIEALEAAAMEMDRLRSADRERAETERNGAPPPRPLPPNALMGGLAPSAYVLKVVSAVRASELEQAVMMLPFTDVLRLLGYLPRWLEAGGPSVELTVRLAVLLVRMHQGQLAGTAAARPVLLALQRRLRGAVQGLKDVVGFNMAAMTHLARRGRERDGVTEGDVVGAAKRQLLGIGAA